MKRGLFDFVGRISQKLFGLATDTDVQACQKRINQAMTINRKVVHTVNDLVTIINQSHGETAENCHHLQHVEEFAAEIQKKLRYIESITQGQNQKISLLDLEAKLDQMLSVIEASQNLWLQQQAKYKRQQASLELGWLTEEILPARELEMILKAGRQKDFVTLP